MTDFLRSLTTREYLNLIVILIVVVGLFVMFVSAYVERHYHRDQRMLRERARDQLNREIERDERRRRAAAERAYGQEPVSHWWR